MAEKKADESSTTTESTTETTTTESTTTEEEKTYGMRLYDSAGNHVADVVSKENLDSVEYREQIVESGGKKYLWRQREGQWREAAGTLSVKASDVPKPES